MAKSIKLGADTFLDASGIVMSDHTAIDESHTDYTKLPDGTLIQWGAATMDAGSSSKTITFSVNFISVPIVVVSARYTNTRNDHVLVAGERVNGFTVYRNDPTTNQQFCSWIAIGKWK